MPFNYISFIKVAVVEGVQAPLVEGVPKVKVKVRRRCAEGAEIPCARSDLNSGAGFQNLIPRPKSAGFPRGGTPRPILCQP